MLYCPVCQRLFEEDGQICPFDETELIAPPDSRLGTKVGNYFLNKILGKGGMGKVYKGEHVFIGKAFAIKILHPQFRGHKEIIQRFLFEARAAARINHPNIVDITDFGYTTDQTPFFVMEYMEGRELIELLLDEAPLPVYRAVNIMLQACDALASCHDEGIVHQDLKPENIFLVKRKGRRKLVKLLDNNPDKFKLEKEENFDLVKILDFGVAHLAQLQTGDTIAGTPEYMAPEQARGVKGDPRSDIYSLGIIFFEMLTGTIPYSGESPSEIFHQAINSPPPEINKLFPKLKFNKQVVHVIKKSLAKKPEKRFQNIDELMEYLRNCFGKTFYSRDIPKVLAQNKKKISQINADLALDLSKLFNSKKNNKRISSIKTKKAGSGSTKAQRNTMSTKSLRKGKKKIGGRLGKDLDSLFKKK
ncbi:MAG: serine/threonine-protein kinase [Deltaproteobacteria bacterium]|jgi:serine/threonine protein kinase|nr:serine/threonine-protein kinase [Deltaproteobacteria bacterium]